MTHSTEEINEAVSKIAAFILTSKMAASIEGEPIPGLVKDAFDSFLKVVPDIKEALDLVDTKLDIEKQEGNGGTST